MNQDQVSVIENSDYAATNNMYSLHLALESDVSVSDVVVLNADCVYEDDLIEKVVNTRGSSLFLDRHFFDEEAMKVMVKDGRCSKISKAVATLAFEFCIKSKSKSKSSPLVFSTL